MEKLKIYSFYDVKSKRFDTPFFCIDDHRAERHFIMALKDQSTMVSTFKNDFNLLCLGEVNLINGSIEKDQRVVVEGIQVKFPENISLPLNGETK